MASWFDLFSLVITTLFFVGTIVGVIYVARVISSSVHSTRESLKSKGISISDKGVSVKTEKRFDRGDYVDATQRGIIKAINAASFGKAIDRDNNHSVRSTTSSNSEGDSEKKGVFGMSMRRSHSGGSGDKK
ncbi:hypothetical protein F5I97DRAFT_1927079 [Phlebopus sp. FC_14]|nr:hypothetical protein F5I97DRAFT_1927079 [Phlebopus sp. FC_14]